MSKAILRFNLPEEREDHEDALNGWKYKMHLNEVWDNVFRPYYKHGYDDEKLNRLLNSNNGKYIMEALVKYYRGVVDED